MFSIIHRTVAFLVFTFLKITIAFTNSVHSLVLDICCIIGDAVQSNANPELTSSQNIPQIDFTAQTDSDVLNVSACTQAEERFTQTEERFTQTEERFTQAEERFTQAEENLTQVEERFTQAEERFTQTEERFTQTTNDVHEKISSTDVFIYNLGTSKKVSITHTDLNSNFMNAKLDRCGNCKSPGKSFLRRIKNDSVDHRAVEKFQSNSSSCSGRYKQESESCNMSIENDVTNAEILHFSHNTTFTKDKPADKESRESSTGIHFENDDLEKEYFCDVDECNEFEDFDENPPVIIYEDDGNSISDEQKTSSPIEKLPQQSDFDAYTQLENISRNQENEFGDGENRNTSSGTSGEFRAAEDIFQSRPFPNSLDSTVLLDYSVKRRLSLASSFGTANEVANFRKIQNEIIENTIKSTPRHEKRVNGIQLPFLSERSLNRSDEEKENSKEMCSSSSYDSLPVSDHIRNALDNNTLFSLYQENLTSAATPDFSSVDDFVEAFQKIKKALSVSEMFETRENVSFPEDSRNEVKRSLRTNSCCIVETQQKTNENNEMTYEDEQNKDTSDDSCSEIQQPAATNVLEPSKPERKCSISPSSLKAISSTRNSFDGNLHKDVEEQIKALFDEIVENIDSENFKVEEEFNGTDDAQSDFDFASKDHLGQSEIEEHDLHSAQHDAENWKQLTHYNAEENESSNSSENQQRTENKTKPIVSKAKQTTKSAHCKAEKETTNENNRSCSGRHRGYARKSFTGSRSIETNKNRIKPELPKENPSAKILKSKTPNDLVSVTSKSSSEMFIIHPEMEVNKPSLSDRLPNSQNEDELTLLDRPSMTDDVENTGREKLCGFEYSDEQRYDMQLENDVKREFLENEEFSTLVGENDFCDDTSSDNSVLTVKDLEVADE